MNIWKGDMFSLFVSRTALHTSLWRTFNLLNVDNQSNKKWAGEPLDTQEGVILIHFTSEGDKTSISTIKVDLIILPFDWRKLIQLETYARLKGELQRENKSISYERAFKMLENDMYITVIGQAVLELLSFKVESGNHQTGISLLQKFSEIFGHMRLISPKMTSYLTSHNFQILKIEISSKPCKIWTSNFKKW